MLDRRDGTNNNSRRGMAATELALVLTPVLAFIMVAGTDFTRVFYYCQTITSCARNGALYGCQSTLNSTSTANIQTAALADAAGLSTQPGVSSSTGTDANGHPYVAVKVTYSFTTLVNYPGIAHTVNLSRT